MADGQLADAHNRIQRLSTELVARDAAMRAECEQFHSAAVHAERRAAIEGEHAAANAVRDNPVLGAAWAGGQLVPADAGFYSAMLRNKEQVDRLVNSKAFQAVWNLPQVQTGCAGGQTQPRASVRKRCLTMRSSKEW